METLISVSRALLLLIGTSAMKAAIVLLITAITVRLLRHRAASLRHLVWTAALGATVALVPLASWIPALHVLPRLESGPRSGVQYALSVPLSALEMQTSAASFPAPRGVTASASARPDPSTWPLWLAALWAAGCLVLVGRYLGQLRVLHRLRLTPASAVEVTLCAAIAREFGIRRPVRLALSNSTPVPLTWGIIAPRIVLPMDAERWTTSRQRHVLCHELAHIRRFDVLSQAIATLAETVFWFFPAVRWAGRAARRDSELACDDAVLGAGVRPSDYADDLLAVGARALVGALPALAFASERTAPMLERRVVALLDPARRRAPLTRRSAVVVIVGAAVMTLALTTLRSRLAEALPVVVRRGTTENVARGQARVTHSALHPATVLPAAAIVIDHPVPVLPLATCTGHMNHHSDADDTMWVATGESNECAFTLASNGSLGFAANGTDLVSIASGGAFDLTINERGTVTHVTVRPDDNGVLNYESDGDAGDAPAAWLSSAMVAIDRQLAFAAMRRLPDILAHGGVEAALNEVAAMRSDHARTVYLSLLARRAVLDPAQSDRAVSLAMTIGQNTDRTRVLRTLSWRSE